MMICDIFVILGVLKSRIKIQEFQSVIFVLSCTNVASGCHYILSKA